jgi:hypothetical protein
VVRKDPTAKQVVAVGHDTPARLVWDAPLGRGTFTIDHVVPFQCSTNLEGTPFVVDEPTAKQLVVVAHDTPFKKLSEAPAAFGLATIDHFVPSQRSVSVRLPALVRLTPTAKQLVGSGHATPTSWLCELPAGGASSTQLEPFHSSVIAWAVVTSVPTAKQCALPGQVTASSVLPASARGFGLTSIVQLVPFQRSINVFRRLRLPLGLPVAGLDAPTATQLVALEQVNPLKKLVGTPDTFGLVTIDQVVPFQRSTNVLTVELVCHQPTAKQLVEDGHDTPLRSVIDAPAGLGIVTIDQTVPFQRSTNCVEPVLAVSIEPTAKQLVALAQATPAREG